MLVTSLLGFVSPSVPAFSVGSRRPNELWTFIHLLTPHAMSETFHLGTADAVYEMYVVMVIRYPLLTFSLIERYTTYFTSLLSVGFH